MGSRFFGLKFVIIVINNKNIKLLERNSEIKFKTTDIHTFVKVSTLLIISFCLQGAAAVAAF